MVKKVTPNFKLEAHSYIGKDLTELLVDFVTDFDATSLASARAPEGAIHKTLQAIMERAAIVMVDADSIQVGSGATDTQMRVFVEGHYKNDAYGHTSNEEFHDYLQRIIRELTFGSSTTGTVATTDPTGSYSLTATTVSTVEVFKAQQV